MKGISYLLSVLAFVAYFYGSIIQGGDEHYAAQAAHIKAKVDEYKVLNNTKYLSDLSVVLEARSEFDRVHNKNRIMYEYAERHKYALALILLVSVFHFWHNLYVGVLGLLAGPIFVTLNLFSATGEVRFGVLAVAVLALAFSFLATLGLKGLVVASRNG